ncbi:hypothetical protein [Cyanobium sp. BA20m-p-22]|uniref:hypothetical protein n=1 Tax=Cyanobium sp. BA20m-p-22 TaxID=2823704 RepID=UPI0020CFE4AD|nr:hypothetical protein [Cyanobium sp. BA20m-p-22]
MAVFVFAVAFNFLPLNLVSPDWGLGISNTIVSSASLALVGVSLLRVSAYLQLQVHSQETSNPKGPRLIALKKSELGIRRLALAGTISLLLLAGWQAILFARGMELITAKGAATSSQAQEQIKAVESRIKSAPDAVIEAEWSKLQASLPPAFFKAELDASARRKELLSSVGARSAQFRVELNRQTSAAAWNLGRNAMRICLMAIAYAWGFYGLHKL